MYSMFKGSQKYTLFEKLNLLEFLLKLDALNLRFDILEFEERIDLIVLLLVFVRFFCARHTVFWQSEQK